MFWDTVAGQEFTKYTIPELINSMIKMVVELNSLKKSHNQYVVTCECESSKINDILTKELESGSRLVNHIKNGNDIFLIFEK